MVGNLMKLKLKPDSSSPSKEMEFGREEVTQNRLKQLNKGSCLYDVCKNYFILTEPLALQSSVLDTEIHATFDLFFWNSLSLRTSHKYCAPR